MSCEKTGNFLPQTESPTELHTSLVPQCMEAWGFRGAPNNLELKFHKKKHGDNVFSSCLQDQIHTHKALVHSRDLHFPHKSFCIDTDMPKCFIVLRPPSKHSSQYYNIHLSFKVANYKSIPRKIVSTHNKIYRKSIVYSIVTIVQ